MITLGIQRQASCASEESPCEFLYYNVPVTLYFSRSVCLFHACRAMAVSGGGGCLVGL